MFPVHNMPAVVQYVTWINPMRDGTWRNPARVVMKGWGFKRCGRRLRPSLHWPVGFLFLASKTFPGKR
jgi:hypothetical protein